MSTSYTYREIWEIIRKTERDSLNWSVAGLEIGPGIKRLLFLNAHAVTTAVTDADFRHALLRSDLLLRDGVGLELALRYLSFEPTENLNGTDLIPLILERFKDRRICIWGSSEEALLKLRHRLDDEGFGNLAPMHHGFHDDDFYVREFGSERPDVVVLCMGMPRQELLGQKLFLPDCDCLVVCGGGWANFHGGHVRRAPDAMRRLKLEWVHRLMKEPSRVGRRYTLGLGAFFVTVFRAGRAGGKRREMR